MTVKELKAALDGYADDAEVVVVDWTNGREYTATVGGDDANEGTEYCRIGF